MNNRRNPFLLNLLLAVVCVFLLLILGGFLVWNDIPQAKTTESLQTVSGEEEIKETAAEEGDPAPQEETVLAEEPQEAEVPVAGISCWGDEFYTGEEAASYSYRSVLQQLLTENGYDLKVADKTLVGASTLSVMKMAGVPQTDLDAYIEAHRQEAAGAELPITETGIRDLTAEQTDRFEKDYIPVLFMGFYGGWSQDVQELIEQQQKVLDTFGANKDKFIIIGLVPLDQSVDLTTYDSAMEEAWGEHYISSAQISSYPQASHEGQADTARALYEKLIELGYISKTE